MPELVGKSVTVWDAISDLAYLNVGEGKEKQKYKVPTLLAKAIGDVIIADLSSTLLPTI